MLLGIILIVVNIWIDTQYSPSFSPDFSALFNFDDFTGIRTLLSTTAAAILGVAGVSFSITIASLTLASQQFGPRLIRTFVRNRFIQMVLGLFVATFLYCIVTLQLGSILNSEHYRPLFTMATVLSLILINLITLVLFIHHICIVLQADSVVNEVVLEMKERAEILFEADNTDHAPDDEDALSVFATSFEYYDTSLCAEKNGYITFIDYDRLLQLASEHNVYANVLHRAGDYVLQAESLMLLNGENTNEPCFNESSKFIVIEDARTPEQDLEYTIRQLVEIALRALSPGINDPFTAMNCIEQLGSLLHYVGQRKKPNRLMQDENGDVRLLANFASYQSLVEASFNQIRQTSKGHVDVSIRLLEILAKVVKLDENETQAKHIRTQAELVMKAALTQDFIDYDMAAVTERYEAFCAHYSDQFGHK